MIKAITFDFWDTLVEAKRATQGLSTKVETRLQLLIAEITRHHPHINPDQVQTAFNHANDHFRHHWKVEHHTPSVAERYKEAYKFLGLDLTPGYDDVVRAVEEMEVEISPDFAPGVHKALSVLAQDYKLGIISDAIHTPGRGLRQILEREGLLQYFDHWVFSDEAGASKPAPIVFEQAAIGLGVSLAEIVHIGDRESNDIEGPLAMGMKAILYTGAIDRDSATTRATAICQDYGDLPHIIAAINS